MRYVILLLLIMTCSSCKEQKDDEVFKGELAFKLINLTSELQKVVKEFGLLENGEKNTLALDTIPKLDKEYFELLIDNDLLDKKYFYFIPRNNKEEMQLVFIDENKLSEQVVSFKYSELIENREKVMLTFSGERLNEYIIMCTHIDKFIVKKGRTYSEK